MRDYNSSTDYHIILKAARRTGYPEISPIAGALLSAGIRWPNFDDPRDATGTEVDTDITRAWRELALHPKP